jgi:hypothetical protein
VEPDKPKSFEAIVHDGRERVTLRIDLSSDYSTAELIALINELSMLRETMLPPVAATPPMKFKAQFDMAHAVISPPTISDGVVLTVRHPGVGWIYWQIPHSRVEPLAVALRDSSRPPPTRQ